MTEIWITTAIIIGCSAASCFTGDKLLMCASVAGLSVMLLTATSTVSSLLGIISEVIGDD